MLRCSFQLQAQWQTTNGPYGSIVYDIAIKDTKSLFKTSLKMKPLLAGEKCSLN